MHKRAVAVTHLNHKKLFPYLLAALLVGALFGSPAAAGGKKKSGPEVVGTDPAGDWGTRVNPYLPPIGNLLGQDLIEASIEMADVKTINFIIKVDSLPPAGGIPEVSRYVWEIDVDSGSFFWLDGRFTNYSRGICDPTSGQCPPPRDPGMYPFIIADRCSPDPTVPWQTCHEAGLVHARFDPSAGTITVPVPLEMIDARPGSTIGAAAGPMAAFFGGNLVATPAVWRTPPPGWVTDWPGDSLKVTRTFVVPRR